MLLFVYCLSLLQTYLLLTCKDRLDRLMDEQAVNSVVDRGYVLLIKIVRYVCSWLSKNEVNKTYLNLRAYFEVNLNDKERNIISFIHIALSLILIALTVMLGTD